jgi:hypothetical protein
MEDPAQATSVANQKLYATRHLKIRTIEALQTGNAGQSLYHAVFVRADTCLVRVPRPK